MSRPSYRQIVAFFSLDTFSFAFDRPTMYVRDFFFLLFPFFALSLKSFPNVLLYFLLKSISQNLRDLLPAGHLDLKVDAKAKISNEKGLPMESKQKRFPPKKRMASSTPSPFPMTKWRKCNGYELVSESWRNLDKNVNDLLPRNRVTFFCLILWLSCQ